MWKLLIQRLSVSDAAAEELRPRGNRRLRFRSLGKEAPKLGVMPAKVMSATVSVVPNPCAQTFGLVKQLLLRHPLEILVHVTSPLGREPISHGLTRRTLAFTCGRPSDRRERGRRDVPSIL